VPPREEESVAPTPNSMICPVCGEHNTPGQTRCVACGAEFNAFNAQLHAQLSAQILEKNLPAFTVNHRPVQTEDEIDGVTVAEAAVCLRSGVRRTNKYLGRFERNNTLGWNWAGLFLGQYWLFFCKIFKPALIFAGVMTAVLLALTPLRGAFTEAYLPVLEAYQEVLTGDNARADLERAMTLFQTQSLTVFSQHRPFFLLTAAAYAAIHVLIALFGDALYRKKVWDDIRRAHEDAGGTDSVQKSTRYRILLRRGGVSIMVPVFVFFITPYVRDAVLYAAQWLADFL
jgi:hypothetical protein